MEVPAGQPSFHIHPHLNNLNVSLSLGGEACFQSPDWKLAVTPLSLSLKSPKLLRGEGLHLLRAEDGEIGISFDKTATRHFFFLGKAPTSTKFTLSLKVLRNFDFFVDVHKFFCSLRDLQNSTLLKTKVFLYS